MKITLKFPYILVIVLSFVISGCISIPIGQVNDRINGWKNEDIDSLIKYWGVPTKKQEISGKFYAEWINQESSQGNSSISIGSGSHSRHSSIGFGLTLFELGGTDDACSRIVTYNQQGSVSNISWTGTQDYCYEITPDREQILRQKAIMQN